jgi:hypothetical protein
MSDSKKHPIRDKVIAGLILALLLWLATFIPGLWAWTKSATRWFFTKQVSTPLWLPVTLALTTIVVLKCLAGFFRREVPSKPNWRDYKSDCFFDMTWRWHYGASGQIENLNCFCPHDDTVLVGTQSTYPNRITFKCETCGKTFGPLDGHWKDLLGRVERQIDRKLRNDHGV